MCQTWLQYKVDDVIDDIIALSDVDDKCDFVQFCLSWVLFCKLSSKSWACEQWITHVEP